MNDLAPAPVSDMTGGRKYKRKSSRKSSKKGGKKTKRSTRKRMGGKRSKTHRRRH
jgi:hypothetical protein